MLLKLNDGELSLPDNTKQAGRVLANVFNNSGYVEDTDTTIEWSDMWEAVKRSRREMKDLTSTPDVRPLLQSSLEILMREPVEPLMVIAGLFTKIQSKGMNTQVLAGAIGAVEATDIAEGGTYPEVQMQIGGGMQTAWIGKSGLAVSYTDEVLRYSTWDIMGMNMKQMGAALVRHKERKAASFLKTLGTELYNNASPATSMFGVTTGRDIGGAANGSMTMDDLFYAMAHMAEEGFQPDILLINPLFFYLFVQDPVLRNMMLSHGGGDWFRPWNGQPGPLDPWSNGGMGAMGPTLGNKISRGDASPAGGTATGIAGREHGMTAQAPIPAPYFPWPMRVVVSPFVPFDPDTQLGDIFLLSSGNVGYLLEDQAPLDVSWRDENVDVLKVKKMERYGFAVAHEGLPVGVMKNVKLTRNWFDGVIRAATLDIDTEIDPNASIDL